MLEPIPDYTIWGNDILSKFRHADKNYGTWWEVSAHPYCTNPIKGSDMTLQELIDSDPDQMLGQGLGHHEMLRVAFLDAKDALSIQVHPYDTYAAEHENDFGKDESWYVIDAVPGAKLVAGTKTSDPDTLKEAVKNGTLEQHLIYHDVKPGDYIDIPAGTLHALGAGIFAIEVGTNSNTTYRFYDYNRKDANGNTRPLHLEKSFDVADFARKPHVVEAKEETRVLSDMPSYTVTEVYAKEDVTYPQNGTYCLISNIGDDTSVETGEKEYELKKFESCFIPASASCVTIKKGAHVLYSKVKG
nr:type I phosphomannose isomerase catalytic subunit [uncultured Dubosiella sp.]